jgi:hypothetical protein
LLYHTEYVFKDQNAIEHFEENNRVLDLLRKDQVIINVPDSFYDQVDNSTQENLANFEDQFDRVDDMEATARAYESLQELRIAQKLEFDVEATARESDHMEQLRLAQQWERTLLNEKEVFDEDDEEGY